MPLKKAFGCLTTVTAIAGGLAFGGALALMGPEAALTYTIWSGYYALQKLAPILEPIDSSMKSVREAKESFGKTYRKWRHGYLCDAEFEFPSLLVQVREPNKLLNIPDANILCAFKRYKEHDIAYREKTVGIASSQDKTWFFVKNEEGERNYALGGKDFQLREFRVLYPDTTTIPQFALVHAESGRERLRVLAQTEKKRRFTDTLDYETIGLLGADQVRFKDLAGSSRQDIVAIGKDPETSEMNMLVLAWDEQHWSPALHYRGATMRDIETKIAELERQREYQSRPPVAKRNRHIPFPVVPLR